MKTTMKESMKRFAVGTWQLARDMPYVRTPTIILALTIAAIFLEKVSEHAMFIAISLIVIVMAYHCWRPAHEGEGNGVLAFAREVWKAVPVLIALIGGVAIVGILGDLTGIALLKEVANLLVNELRGRGLCAPRVGRLVKPRNRN